MAKEPTYIGYAEALAAAKAGKHIARKWMVNRPSLNRVTWNDELNKLTYIKADGTKITGLAISKTDEDATDWVVLN
jgi:hypothetical protein